MKNLGVLFRTCLQPSTNIIPVIDTAIKQAGINKMNIDAIAYTNGPGLLGSLLVGSSFAKSFALALKTVNWN